MRIRVTTSCGSEKVEQQMTPMIDIVFQLLVFFILTFKIAALEGDFALRMPRGHGDPFGEQMPIRVRLTAGAGGELASIRMGERELPSFNVLHNEIVGIVGTDTGPGSLAESAEV